MGISKFEYQRNVMEHGYNYSVVEPLDFYREIFPHGELDKKAERDKNGKPLYKKHNGEYKYNGIALEIYKDAENQSKVRRYTITDDFEVLEELLESDNFCLLSPISYVGKERSSKNARMLYALCIEIDNITCDKETGFPDGLALLLGYFEKGGLPTPTYLVLSGSGLHLYYVFEKPIALFPSAVKSLEAFKRDLTEHLWIKGITNSFQKHEIQYESLFQGFRLVGGVTKYGDRATCYKVGKRVTVEYLNSGYWVFPENHIKLDYQPSKLSLEKAKELYPEWYNNRIVKKTTQKGRWVCNRAVYDWWKRKLTYATFGHRYYFLFVLCIYAIKCDISREEVEKDCFEFLDFLDSLSPDESASFTEKDVMDALQTYENGDLVTYPISSIINRTGIDIPKNRRNGRKQKDHLARARAVQNIESPNGEWRKGNGRPSKKQVVNDWQIANPTGRKVDCIKETGLTKPTVYKWWDNFKKESE